ncbi:MAG: prepilin-type N-terminal cleavage/methylation domain-containing protein [Verrucomicrobia bacterium]|nr:prepilin-type N-terminal cleavage/methylation domain-containing protein [Verrucomicrobiota bacterium]
MRTPTHSFALSPQSKLSNLPHPTPAKSAKSATPTTFSSKQLSHPASGRVPQPRDSHIKILRSSARFTETERSRAAFTLIELMAATTVLSVILLMMVGMQDQMSKAWSNANRRTDATREARAACMLMARDLSTFAMRGKAFGRFDSFQTNLTNAGVPFYYFNGSGGIAPGGAPNCAQFFGLIPQASKGIDPADIALVGYYIALATNTNVNGFTNTSWNLFRYYIAPSNAAAGIATWLSTTNGTATALFTNIATNSEILARNACNLQITIYGSTTATSGQITNGLNFSNNGSSSGFYRGNKIGLELSFYPEDVAQKITNSTWMDTANIQKYARSFEFKIDCPKN